MQDGIPNLLRGNTESLLLFLVDELKQAYGYQLIRETEKRSRGFFKFKEGTVYPTLRKLENDGLLEGEWKQMSTGLERRYYRITDKGKWENFAAAVNLILNPSRP
jgi:DNA-binding PadR family transcriptional regulator